MTYEPNCGLHSYFGFLKGFVYLENGGKLFLDILQLMRKAVAYLRIGLRPSTVCWEFIFYAALFCTNCDGKLAVSLQRMLSKSLGRILK